MNAVNSSFAKTCLFLKACRGALPGEYRLKFVVHNQVLSAVEPAEVAQYPLHDHLTLFHGHGGKKDDILADAVTGVHVAAAQGVPDGMVQMLHGLVEDRCPGGMSVQITDGEQTQIDGIPGRLNGPAFQLEQIVEYRILTVKCPSRSILLKCLLDGIQVCVDTLLLP